jgi:hypothetical protein
MDTAGMARVMPAVRLIACVIVLIVAIQAVQGMEARADTCVSLTNAVCITKAANLLDEGVHENKYCRRSTGGGSGEVECATCCKEEESICVNFGQEAPGYQDYDLTCLN